jgi:hypothetical protein
MYAFRFLFAGIQAVYKICHAHDYTGSNLEGNMVACMQITISGIGQETGRQYKFYLNADKMLN